jgi:NAD(P)-dependent dehydrogenase (short-subunit alcohol dehydrogenase family)
VPNGKSILIIGAERGLGLGLAKQFFDRGWHVTGTSREGDDTTALMAIGNDDPGRLRVESIDVTTKGQISPLIVSLGDRRFDVIFSNAGIWGKLDQDLLSATDSDLLEVMLTNAFGPVRLAKHLLGCLADGGTVAFMTSHRASMELNVEGNMDLYRPSKAALNMLARSLWATNRDRDLTVLLIHPGWAATAMGTLNGTVEAEIEIEPSVRGCADVVERRMGSGENWYGDYENNMLPW